ncbi:hypothetical protein ACOSQ2_016777 [Xanthoceras sorbifolium]
MPDPSKSKAVSPENRRVVDGVKSMEMNIEVVGLKNFLVDRGPMKSGYSEKLADAGPSFVKAVEVGLQPNGVVIEQVGESDDQQLAHAASCIMVSNGRVKTLKWKRQARSKGMLSASSEVDLGYSKRQYMESTLEADRCDPPFA